MSLSFSTNQELVRRVAFLAMRAHTFMKGKHSRKTGAFVKVCVWRDRDMEREAVCLSVCLLSFFLQCLLFFLSCQGISSSISINSSK